MQLKFSKSAIWAVPVVAATFLTLQTMESHAQPPQIIAGTNGEAEVIFKNRCVVYYNRRGVMRKQTAWCSAAQRARAAKAIAAYRREQGLSGPVQSHSPEPVPPRLVARPNGAIKVSFPNNKCVIRYNRRGDFKKQTAWCSAAHRKRAARAVRAYRREQGLGG